MRHAKVRRHVGKREVDGEGWRGGEERVGQRRRRCDWRDENNIVSYIVKEARMERLRSSKRAGDDERSTGR
jgi:hypothetical protein